MIKRFCFIFLPLFFVLSGMQPVLSQSVRVSDAEIFCGTTDKGSLLRSVEVLQTEIGRRSGISLPLIKELPVKGRPLIVLVIEKDLVQLPEKYRSALSSMPTISAEGFKLLVLPEDKTVLIVGKDARGLLYGVGRFLRKAEIRTSEIAIPESASISTSPAYPLRGHQLGYRPKTNSYDAFSVAQYDQYIRELALFGANTIEIMPPVTDDDFTSSHMQLPAARMIVEQSRICNEYGLDVSMWYPNMGKDYLHPDSIRKELKEREQVFSSLPRLDALFVPAGDPGDLEPEVLFAWLKQVAVVLRKHHPQAKIWLSPQAFKPTSQWFDSFFTHVNQEYSWFGGVVFGPWVKVPLQEIRKRVKPTIPIRRYPDITHNFSAQYPLSDWDVAWAMTLGRESITPRPYEQKAIHNALDEFAVGSVSYSEGTNDDVNKFVWSDQEWDPQTPVIETLRDYARFFIGVDYAETVTQGLVGLENNMKGKLLNNGGINRTLEQWQYVEKDAPLRVLQNPRFQMGLIRAYFDAYTYRRLIYETALEQEARDLLLNVKEDQSIESIHLARAVLERARKEPVLPTYRQKCLALADSLYKSIGAQLTVERHGGKEERGNFIDHIDMPLNDSPWLLDQLSEIEKLPTERERIDKIEQILHRTDPGPGGLYDYFGDRANWNRIVPGIGLEKDPGSLQSPRESFNIRVLGASERNNNPRAWLKQVAVLYDLPLKIQYDDLDKNASYKMRITYTGRFKSHIRLGTDNGYLIHDYLLAGEKPIYEFKVPHEVTADGKVTFIWNCKAGERGLQVTEIWLIKE